MEPATHFLTGACLARTGLNRATAYATLAVTLAAEAPDLDVVFALGGPVTGFQHHRGFTHTLLGSPFVALAVVGFVYLLHRLWLGREPNAGGLRPRWGLLFLFCWLAALSHVLLDFTNNYGVRPFAPFSWRWYSWDIVFIVDPVLLAVLTAGLIMPSVLRLVNGQTRNVPQGFSGRGWAAFALACMVLWWGIRDHQHRRAVSALSAQKYEQEYPKRSSAFPYPLNPRQWHGVVETKDFFETVPVNTASANMADGREGQIFYKQPETPATLAAKRSRLGMAYLSWAQYPMVESMSLPTGTEVLFWDLRFAYPALAFLNNREDGVQRPPLGASVLLNRENRVVEMRMGNRVQPPD